MFKSKEEFKKEFAERLSMTYGQDLNESDVTERYNVLGSMVRDYSCKLWRGTKEKIEKDEKRSLIYFSMEFLIGRLLVNNMQNLGIYEVAKDGLNEMGFDIHELEEVESDAGLGNGGLGRLAACFLDSIASLGYPGNGNCIRYEYGFFKQKLVDGKQTEIPDQWLTNGNVWEVRKPKHAVEVMFGGYPETYFDDNDQPHIRTVDPIYITAMPYDVSVVGYRNNVTNTLRLWSAEPSSQHLPENIEFQEYLTDLKRISHGLYPNDSTEDGRLLRLKQQYFLVSAGLQSACRAHYRRYGTFSNFAEKYVFQLNDTHPILAIPELMRIMMDDYNTSWDEAWTQIQKSMAYTNHTVLQEALEKWPIHHVQRLLPRCYMIIEEINRRFNNFLTSINVDENTRRSVAIIKDGMLHMANLAIYAGFSVNGVAALHTKILKENTFKDFYGIFPDKFNNKTNGVTHRRWLLNANPELANLITSKIGDGWILNADELEKLADFADDKELQDAFLEMKSNCKGKFAKLVKKMTDIDLDTNTIFDTQIKRLHAYKRQLMNIFRIMIQYNRMKNDPTYRIIPHTYIFGAKAAPSYYYAKKIIELILDVARIVNNDEETNKYLKVVFIENYGVSLAECIIPATDISEQISTAGKEASGTSNMKFMMNGALTLGTLDGANVEIAERVGDEHCQIFGLKDYEVEKMKLESSYNPWDVYNSNAEVKELLDSLLTGKWSEGDKEKYRVIFDEIMYRGDEYFVLKDLPSYMEASDVLSNKYNDKRAWAKSAIINIAKSGTFSSDRTIHQYVDEIWHLKKVND